MNYKDYVKQEIDRASSTDHFDINGNSTLATSNRGFLSEIRMQFKSFNSDILNSIDFKELTVQVINALMILFIPITYIPILILRTVVKRRCAHKEMYSEYIKIIKKKV